MPSARKGNGFDPTVTQRFVGEIERHLETIDTYKGEHARRCQSVREMITDVYELAKGSGIPPKELRAVIRARGLQSKLDAVREDLDDFERQETFDQIRLALGELSELPLGAAPLAKAADAPAGDPNKEAAERNAAAVKDGITEMSPAKQAKARAGKNGIRAASKQKGAEALDELTDKATGADDGKDLRPRNLRTGSAQPEAA